MVSILIVTHGEFGAYVLDAAEEIVGRDPKQSIAALKISGRIPLIEVRQKITDSINQFLQESEGAGVLVVCDMLGGTPCNEVLLACRNYPNVEVLAGVNLYMVVSAMLNARRLSLARLVEKVLEDSKRSITNAKALFYARQKNNA